LAGGLLEPTPRNFAVWRNPVPGGVQIAQRGLRFRQTLLGGFFVPVKRLISIGLNAVSLEEHNREVVLGDALALLGCAPIPDRPFGEIARDTLTRAVHGRELKLGTGMPGFGGAAKPLTSLL